jgi:hypothetical protein
MCLDLVLKDFAGLITALIASGVALYIACRFTSIQATAAERQAAIAHDKLKYDLFEKRYKIYNEAKELITYVIDHSQRNECKDSDLNKYYAILDEAPFFFPPDVCTAFNNIISLTRQLVEGYAKQDRPTANIVVELDKIFDDMPKTFEHVMSFQQLTTNRAPTQGG